VIEHGGNLAAAAERYGIEPSRWLDLSTGISPFAYPVGALAAQAWHRLPEETTAFRRAAAAYYGSKSFIAVPGSQAAIQLLPRLIPARSVAIAQPTYAEHAGSWRVAGATVELLPEDAIEDAAVRHDFVVLCNPNNPTGRWWRPAALRALHERLARRGGWLILDEAFIDTEPRASRTRHAGEPGLVVLRSLGKFFGMAGARVGFLFAPAELLARAAALLGPWPISGPSLAAAETALADDAFQRRARTQLRAASSRLQALLRTHGHAIAGATDFFVWVRHPEPRRIQDHLARAAILVRAFDEPPSLRFGLPDAEAAWQRLEDALAAR
jgi:cobalamin biosynthetic protein CobC